MLTTTTCESCVLRLRCKNPSSRSECQKGEGLLTLLGLNASEVGIIGRGPEFVADIPSGVELEVSEGQPSGRADHGLRRIRRGRKNVGDHAGGEILGAEVRNQVSFTGENQGRAIGA